MHICIIVLTFIEVRRMLDVLPMTAAFMAEFNKMSSVINGLAANFDMEKADCE